MTTPRSPEGEMVDIMELDREIEALRLGPGRSEDRALTLLLDLRDDVDRRTATLLGGHDLIPETVPETQPEHPAAASPRRRRHHRLAVIPIAGALLVASTGAAAALSGSPHAPLYPLHRLIFGAAPGSDRQLGRDLAEVQVLLNRAANEPYSARAGALAQARTVLAQARSLLPMATLRTQFSLELSAALARLAALETPPTTANPLPLPTPLPTPGGESEAPTQPEPESTGTESSGPTGGEFEAPQSTASEVQAPAGGTPEAVTSAAHQYPGASDDARGTASGPGESEAPDN